MIPDNTTVCDGQASGAPASLVDCKPDVKAVFGQQHWGCSDRVYPSFSVESSCHNALCGLAFELVAALSVNPNRRGRACIIYNPSTYGSFGTSSIKCVSGVIDCSQDEVSTEVFRRLSVQLLCNLVRALLRVQRATSDHEA